jgi:hypothetical protein
VGGGDVDAEVGDQPGQARHLALGQLHDEARKRGRVDDWMFERALQAAADQPGVERVVAVLYEHGAVGEAQEGSARVLEHGRADEHRAVDVVAPPRIRVDRGAAVDQGVEERKRPLEGEAFRSKLEHEKRSVAGRLDVEGDELCVVERRQRPDLGCVDRDLLPRHERGRSPRLQEKGLTAQRAITSARRAHAISSFVTARSRSTAIV